MKINMTKKEWFQITVMLEEYLETYAQAETTDTREYKLDITLVDKLTAKYQVEILKLKRLKKKAVKSFT